MGVKKYSGENFACSHRHFLLKYVAKCVWFQPLYIRYDPNPIPGLIGAFPLYLSEHPVSNTRWRVLPKQRPDLTRFEQEGEAVQVSSVFYLDFNSHK